MDLVSFPESDWIVAVPGDFVDVPWMASTGGTPSPGTGPAADHTTGSGTYMYVEASCNSPPSQTSACLDECPEGRRAILLSPVFAEGSLDAVSFWYHMWGRGPEDDGALCDAALRATFMGRMYMQALDELGNPTPLWFADGDQGEEWLYSGPLYVPASAVQLRLVYETGSHWASDAAVDDIALFRTEETPSDTLTNLPDNLLGQAAVPTNVPTPMPIDPTVFVENNDDTIEQFFQEEGYLLLWITIAIVGCCLCSCLSFLCLRRSRSRDDRLREKDVTELKISLRDTAAMTYENTASMDETLRRPSVSDLDGFRGRGGDREVFSELKLRGPADDAMYGYERPRFVSRAQQSAVQPLIASMANEERASKRFGVLRAKVGKNPQGIAGLEFTSEELISLLRLLPSSKARVDAVELVFGGGRAAVLDMDDDFLNGALCQFFSNEQDFLRAQRTIDEARIISYGHLQGAPQREYFESYSEAVTNTEDQADEDEEDPDDESDEEAPRARSLPNRIADGETGGDMTPQKAHQSRKTQSLPKSVSEVTDHSDVKVDVRRLSRQNEMFSKSAADPEVIAPSERRRIVL